MTHHRCDAMPELVTITWSPVPNKWVEQDARKGVGDLGSYRLWPADSGCPYCGELLGMEDDE